MEQVRAAITAVGKFLPEDRLTNADLEKLVETSDEWIFTRTGIRERRILKDPDKATSYMAARAAEEILSKRGISAEEIDLVIVATVTPDMFFPSTACMVMAKIGATNAWGYDVSAACSGFLFALTTGAQFIQSGKHSKVLVIGGGVSGMNAADMAIGLGAEVTIVDRSLPRLRELDDIWGGRVHTIYSTRHAIDELAPESDLIIGAVLVAGAAAPKLVSAQNVKDMQAGSVMVDISIDQGGCFETSRPTTHADPTYVVDDVVHYCVTNMPGAVPRTSTYALTNATLPFIRSLANLGWKDALVRDPHLANGLNVHAGHVNHEAVAHDLGYDYLSAAEALQAT